jgi:hypothetical protein
VARAAKYRIADYLRLSTGTGSFKVNGLGIRQHLAQGLPVVFVLLVGSSFDHLGRRYVWKPTQRDAERLAAYKAGQQTESGLTGHAMTIVGYDDEIAGGVFIVQNSWGTGWGIAGRCAIRYDDFQQWCVEAYGLYLTTEARNGNRTAELTVGLRSTLERSFLLQGTGPYTFRSQDTLPVGEKFRLEISNTRPCYLYALTLARSDSVVVLHPPDSSRSPRLATAGTRLIPTEDALVADYQGAEEELLVLASTDPLALDSLLGVWNRQPKYLTLLGRVTHTLPGLVPIADANLADGNLVRCSLPLRPGAVLPLLFRLPK